MKISLSEERARKWLTLIPCTTNDPDLLQMREQLERGLEKVSAAIFLNAEELEAVLWATMQMAEEYKQYHRRIIEPSTGPRLRQLETAIPKLQMLRDRARDAALV